MGIGDGIIPDILNREIYDDIYIVTDEEALQTAKDLAVKEGIMCGISSGTNVAAALKLAEKLGEGKTVVTILPDTAERYFSSPVSVKTRAKRRLPETLRQRLRYAAERRRLSMPT